MTATSMESPREHWRRRLHLLHQANNLADREFEAEIVAECEAADALFRELEAVKRAVHALHRPVTIDGQVWCDECSTQRSTGLRTSERVAYIPYPCRTVQALDQETP